MASIPPFPDVVSIWRPFGAAAPTYSNVPARVVPCFLKGRGSYSASNYMQCTHWIDVAVSVDLRDASSRAAGETILSYADGDMVKATLNGLLFTFVVALVEVRYSSTPNAYKRAWVVRDSVGW